MPRKKEEIVIKDSPYIAHSKERALRKSIVEGSLYSTSHSFSTSFITPFALAIGSNSFHIGVLSSFSGLVAPLGQLRSSKLMEKYSRKSIIIKSKFLQAFFWLAIIGVAYLFWKGIVTIYLPYVLILLYVILTFLGGLIAPAWFSWMGDIVPEKERGKYFAKRNRIIGFVGVISFIIGAFLLDFFKTKGYILLGFGVIFGVAIIFQFISRAVMKTVFNPNFRVGKGYYFSFWNFLKTYDNYGKFAVFQAVFFFSVMISAPFFTVYMLNDLGFSYVTFTMVILSSTVFYLIFTPLAGKFSDRYGNVKLLYVAGFLFPLVPLLWIFFRSPIFLILFPGLISGVANAAFSLGITNFTYDSVSPQKRGLCVAYTSLLVGVGVFGGGIIGGTLVQYLHITFMKPILFVFLISTILMIMTALFFLPQIKEERHTERMKGFSVDFHHPFRTVHSDVVWFKNFLHEK
ncbi:MAG: MFS transporter [Nanoarchaeota archaeon]|nr:MFS transporter [Nanoarchaeota archaeon]